MVALRVQARNALEQEGHFSRGSGIITTWLVFLSVWQFMTGIAGWMALL